MGLQSLVATLILLSTTLLEAAEPPLRVRDDLARGIRWHLGWSSVTAYDVATGQPLRVVPLDGANQSAARESCAPDMLVGRTGAVIVSSNAQPALWRISPSRFEVERFEIELDRDHEKDFGFGALAWGENERVIYAASAIGTALWRIDLATGSAKRMDGAWQGAWLNCRPCPMPENRCAND